MRVYLLLIPLILLSINIANFDRNGNARVKTDLSSSNRPFFANRTLNKLDNANVSDLSTTTVKIPGSLLTPPDSPKDVAKSEKDLPEKKSNDNVVLSDRAKIILDGMKLNPANLSDSYLLHLDLTKFQVVIEDDAFDILSETYVINNEESIGDVLLGVLENGHKHRPRKHSTSSAVSSTSTTPMSSPPNCKITVSRLPDGQAVPERPQGQKKSLAQQNCGLGRKKFKLFSKKHIIDPKSTDTSQFAGLAYLTTLLNRIHEAFLNFSWFFIPNVQQITYRYEEKDDKCLAQEYFPMVTCQRHKESDHIAVCYNAGTCKPSYYSTTGHLVRPQCQTEDQVGREAQQVPDFFASLENIRQVQDMFAAKMLAAPPMERDWAMSEWRSRWWTSHGNDEDLDLNRFPEPTGQATQREILFAKYLEALEKLHIESIPDEVYRLFYFQPRLYLEQLPSGHRQGLLFIRDTMMSVNLDFVRVPTTEGIPDPPGPRPLMNEENFPELGAPRQRTYPEYQANPLRETYAQTTQRIAELIRSIFSNQPSEQIKPTAADVNALY